MNTTERRQYFRITDRLPIEFRIICKEDYEVIERKIKYKPTQVVDAIHEMDFLKRVTSRTEKDKDRLYGYLQLIDKKLDLILNMLVKERGDDQYIKQYAEINLSGAGLQFLSEVSLEKDGWLELRIILPVFPYPKISTLCQVVRAAEQRENGALCWQVALTFLVINEEDRDLLINYIFTREREALRSSKEVTG